MENPDCLDRASFGTVITWYRWQAGLALLGVILCLAATDSDFKTGAAARDQPFAQIAHVDHDAPVWALTFYGKTHLAWSTTSEIRLNELATGQIIGLQVSPGTFGPYPTFSADGRALAAWGMEAEVRFWDVATGSELEPLEVDTEGVRSVAFSPDGTTLAVATSNSPIVTLYDWPNRRRLGALDGRGGSINILTFAPDGKTLLTADSAADVQLWDVASRHEPHTAGCTTRA